VGSLAALQRSRMAIISHINRSQRLKRTLLRAVGYTECGPGVYRGIHYSYTLDWLERWPLKELTLGARGKGSPMDVPKRAHTPTLQITSPAIVMDAG
jgi:hypothetical protein